MRFTATAAAAMVGVAAASYAPEGHYEAPSNSTKPEDVYTTEVVTAYTTFCPVATEIEHGGQTYTATASETLTITNCAEGCTVTKPAETHPATYPAESHPVEVPVTTSASAEAPEETHRVEQSPEEPEHAPSAPAPVAPVYPTGNATAPEPAPVPSGTGAPAPSGTDSEGAPIQSGNAASRFSVGAAGLLAMFGLVAAL